MTWRGKAHFDFSLPPKSVFSTTMVWLVSLAGLTGVSSQQADFHLTRTFLNPEPASGDRFGARGIILNDLVLIGASGDDFGGNDSGSAYLFHGKSGKLLRTFRNPSPNSGDQFGISMAWDGGDHIVISALGDDSFANNGGAAHVFQLSSGSFLRTLFSPNPASGGEFGRFMDSVGDLIAIGAPGDSVLGAGGGAAYLFDPATGDSVQTYQNPNPTSGDEFGFFLDADEDEVLITARRDDHGATDAGIAYLFDALSGQLLRTIPNPNPQNSDRMGTSGAMIADDFIVVGVPFDDEGGSDTGSAHVFDKKNGSFLRTLLSPNRTAGGLFGLAAPFGNLVVIGAQVDRVDGIRAGAGYLFDPNNGNLIHIFKNPNPNAGDQFGARWFTDGEKLWTGAFADNSGASETGIAYLFGSSPDESCTQSVLVNISCLNGISPIPSTEELYLRIVSGDLSAVGCGIIDVSTPILLDFPLDCNQFLGGDPVSCRDISEQLALELGVSISSQGNEIISWSPVGNSGVEIRGTIPFACILVGHEVGAETGSGQGYLLNNCSLFNLCDGAFGNESNSTQIAGIAITCLDRSCPPTPTPRPTLTPTPTFTVTPTMTPTPTHTNAPPNRPVVRIEPVNPKTLDDLVCIPGESIDPEGSPLTFLFSWRVDGNPVANETNFISHLQTQRDEIWECLVRASDGIDLSLPGSAQVYIRNTTPTAPVIEILPEIPTPDDGLAVQIVQESTDDDEDAVLYLFEWFDSPDGSTWKRRPELSGNLNPFFPGEPEISSLFTRLIQAAEFWRVDVTPVEFRSNVKSNRIKGPASNQITGDKATGIWRILPDLDGNDSVDANDLHVLRSIWKSHKSELDQEKRDLIFDDADGPNSSVGIRDLLNLMLEWQAQK